MSGAAHEARWLITFSFTCENPLCGEIFCGLSFCLIKIGWQALNHSLDFDELRRNSFYCLAEFPKIPQHILPAGRKCVPNRTYLNPAKGLVIGALLPNAE